VFFAALSADGKTVAWGGVEEEGKKITGTAHVWDAQSLPTTLPELPKEPAESPAEKPLDEQADADKGIKELQGKWRAVEFQTGGNPVPKEVLEKTRLEVKDDELTWHSGGTDVRKSRIRLDPSKSPREIDITILDGPDKDSTFPGIYALEKGQLRLCYSHTNDRPKDFKTERGELRELVILEREKPR
jgi:uncharacterized protein (TIGR03067 family)